MKAKDHICLGKLSFGIFRVPQLRYQGGGQTPPSMGQYLKIIFLMLKHARDFFMKVDVLHKGSEK